MDQGAGGSPAGGGRKARDMVAGALTAIALLAVAFGAWTWMGGRDTAPHTAVAPAPAEVAAAEPEPAPEPAPEPGTQDAVTPEAVADAAPEPATPDAAQAEAEVAPEPAVPVDGVRFDMLRAAPGGAITVAGAVAPGARVEVLLDGAVVDTVTAGPDGKFASVTLGDPSAQPRELRVRTTAPDGTVTEPEESLTVAPDAAAVAAEAEAAGAPQSAAVAAAVAEAVAQAEALAAKPIVSEPEGVRVLAEAAPVLVIDTLAFAADGGIEISGRGAPAGSLLRAYVDNAEAGLVGAGTEGAWRMVLPGAQPGPHVLRIDASDAQGQVLSRAETEFTAAPRAVLDAAAQGGEGGTRPRAITIESGYTLWAIARETYGDPYLYVRVFEANRDQIRNPDRIYPGQVLTLPE